MLTPSSRPFLYKRTEPPFCFPFSLFQYIRQSGLGPADCVPVGDLQLGIWNLLLSNGCTNRQKWYRLCDNYNIYILLKYYIGKKKVTGFVISLMQTSHYALSLSFVGTVEECDPYRVTEAKAQRNISVKLQTGLKELLCVCVYSCWQSLNLRAEVVKIFLDCCKKKGQKSIATWSFPLKPMLWKFSALFLF